MNLVTMFLLVTPHVTGAALPMSAAHALPVVAAPSPSSQFAADVLAAHDAGWRLRDVEVADTAKGVRVSLTMASRVEAWRYTLVFDQYDARASGYETASVKVPTHGRIYTNETEIMDALEQSPPGKLQEECGSYVFEIGDDWLTIDDTAYHTVPRRAKLGKAGIFVAEEIADAIGDGLDLVDVTDEPGENGENVISLEFDGIESRKVVAYVGDKNRVLRAEVMVSPSGQVWRHYRAAAQLRRQARIGVEIHRLVLEPAAKAGGEARLVGTMRGGRRLVVDLGDFEEAEYGCGC